MGGNNRRRQPRPTLADNLRRCCSKTWICRASPLTIPDKVNNGRQPSRVAITTWKLDLKTAGPSRCGRIVSVPVIIAVGGSDGRREVLGVDIGPSQTETFWTEFLRDPKCQSLPRYGWSTGSTYSPSWASQSITGQKSVPSIRSSASMVIPSDAPTSLAPWRCHHATGGALLLEQNDE